MTIQELLQWWNLIYAAPLLISLVWIVITVVSGVDGSHGHDADHDISHDTDHDIRGDGNAITHAANAIGNTLNTGNGAHGPADIHGYAMHDTHNVHSHQTQQNDGLTVKMLALLGIGKVPITLIIALFLLSWGAIGMSVNQFMEGTLKYPLLYIWPSLGITFAASSLFTRLLIALFARFMPGTETYAVSRLGLCGSIGKVIYTVSDNAGTVDIKDSYGTIHRVQAKAASGSEAISSGKEVIVVDFDEGDKRFIVQANEI